MPVIEEIISDCNHVTLLTAKKTIHSLADYLHMKGLYLLAKLNPVQNPFGDEENVRFALQFLNSTQLSRCLFWKTMTLEQKMTIVKSMTMRDEKNMHLTTTSSFRTGEIYLLMSGKAQLVTMNKNSEGHGKKNKQTLRMGGVFGAIDLFNSEMEDTDVVVTYTANISSGTVLKLKFKDYYVTKYGNQADGEEGLGDLTPQDLTIRLVQREGYKKFSSNMNQFLRKCNIIPSTGSDTSSVKYICEGSRGRSLEVSRKENEVLFIIQGEVKIVLEKSIIAALKDETDRLNEGKDGGYSSDEEEMMTGRQEGGSITVKRQGEPAMTVSMAQIPLAVLEAGSILIFDEDMFSTFTATPQQSSSHHPTSHHPSLITPSSNSNISSEHDEHEPEEPMGLPPLPDPHGRKERDSGKNSVSYVNHMSIIFEKPTIYLSVPLKRIKNCLQGESYQTNLDIRAELRAVCMSLAERIKKLKPFLLAPKVVMTKNRKPRNRPPQRLFDSLCNGDIESGRTDLQGTYSGVNLTTLQQQHPLCGESISDSSSIGGAVF